MQFSRSLRYIGNVFHVFLYTEDDSVGSLSIGWRGPSWDSLYDQAVINCILSYFQDNSSSLFQRVFVECSSPWANEVSASLDVFSECLIEIIFSGVDMSSLDGVLEESKTSSDVNLFDLSSVWDRGHRKASATCPPICKRSFPNELLDGCMNGNSSSEDKDTFLYINRESDMIENDTEDVCPEGQEDVDDDDDGDDECDADEDEEQAEEENDEDSAELVSRRNLSILSSGEVDFEEESYDSDECDEDDKSSSSDLKQDAYSLYRRVISLIEEICSSGFPEGKGIMKKVVHRCRLKSLEGVEDDPSEAVFNGVLPELVFPTTPHSVGMLYRDVTFLIFF